IVSTRKIFIESLPSELVILIIERMDDESKSHLFHGNVIASENLEDLYRKDVFNFFNRNDPTALVMIKQAAEGGHSGAKYVLVIISIFEDGESMREGLICITNMKCQ
ncbi:hypothetical protein EJD97_013523, partial [Solanum chilense]